MKKKRTKRTQHNSLYSDVRDFLHRKTYAGRLAIAEHKSKAARRKALGWDRLSRDQRRKVALAAGVSERIADVWAKIRYRDLPEPWRDVILRNLGAARNPMPKKKQKKKKKTVRRRRANAHRKPIRRRKPARRKNVKRPRRKAVSRRRNSPKRRIRKTTFPIPVTTAQGKKIARWVRTTFGRRVKMQ